MPAAENRSALTDSASYCALSKLGIPRHGRPEMAGVFISPWSLKHELTHVQTHIQIACQIPQSHKGNQDRRERQASGSGLPAGRHWKL